MKKERFYRVNTYASEPAAQIAAKVFNLELFDIEITCKETMHPYPWVLRVRHKVEEEVFEDWHLPVGKGERE